MLNLVQKHEPHGFSQFELTKNIVTNLQQFKELKLTPTAKLVLVLLSTYYNSKKNGAVVFPSMPHIAETLDISLTSTKQAIKDLINAGLIIKTKRDKISGNYNKYLLTPKVRNSTSEQSEIDLSKQSESDLFMRTNNQEQIKNKSSFKKVHLIDVPNFIKENKKILNPCAYWASLSEEDQKELLKIQKEKEKTEKEIEEIKEQIAEEKRKEEELLKQREEDDKRPLEEKFPREKAIKFILNHKPMGVERALRMSVVRDLVKLYNLDINELFWG